MAVYLVMQLDDFKISERGDKLSLDNPQHYVWKCKSPIAVELIFEKITEDTPVIQRIVLQNTTVALAAKYFIAGTVEQVTNALSAAEVKKLTKEALLAKAVKFDNDPIDYDEGQ